MEAVSGGSRIYHTPTLGSVVNSIKWNHTKNLVSFFFFFDVLHFSFFFNADLVVARSEDDKNIYICGKKIEILNSRSRGLTESVMSSSRKCKSDDSTARDVNCNLFKTKMRASVYDSSEASSGWTVVTGTMAGQFLYFRLLSDKEGHNKWFGGG
ncbi:unnamed protein product [Brassica oleracea]|nr:unnamed protein product [Brassica napus]